MSWGVGGQVVKAPNLNLIFALQYVLEVDGGGGVGGEVNTPAESRGDRRLIRLRRAWDSHPEAQEGTQKVNWRRSLSLRWAAHLLLLEDH